MFSVSLICVSLFWGKLAQDEKTGSEGLTGQHVPGGVGLKRGTLWYSNCSSDEIKSDLQKIYQISWLFCVPVIFCRRRVCRLGQISLLALI